MEARRIYISGKICEEVISDATRQKFARAEEMLKELKNQNADVGELVSKLSLSFEG